MAKESMKISHLNPQQQEAIRHLNGPLLILAGAGSGKTMTMAHRIAYLISQKSIKPSAILGLSFTNKAARELKERAISLCQKNLPAGGKQGLTISTFHSLCLRLIKEFSKDFYDVLNWPRDFTLIDSNDQIAILRSCLRQIKIDDRKFDPFVVLSALSLAKNRNLSGEAAEQWLLNNGMKNLSEDYAIVAAAVFRRYEEKLLAQQSMDFDDLLVNALRLLEKVPDVANTLGQRFRYVMVDEYQDTNTIQFEFLRRLCQSHQNLCVVGDDDQSIYAWRGADPSHILNFKNHYPSAKVIVLAQNYRCTENILDAANQVIAENKKRHPKKLWSDRGRGELLREIILEDDRQENEWLAREIRHLQSQGQYRWQDMAVLFRSNAQSRAIEEALRFEQVPYKILGGSSYLDKKEIKDVLAYWRVICDPSDDNSLRRIINWPSRGIGSKTLQELNEVSLHEGLSLWQAMDKAVQNQNTNKKIAAAVKNFLQLLEELKNDLQKTPAEAPALSQWMLRTLQRIGITQALQEDEVAAKEGRLLSLQILCQNVEFRQDLKSAPCENALPMLQNYLQLLTIDPTEEKTTEENSYQVTLMTLHSAKGLEFPVVFMVGLEDGLLPHKKCIEEGQSYDEERRLCYVGITRAKDLLYLSRCRNRIKWAKPIPCTPSRFLSSIAEDLMERRDLSCNPEIKNEVQQAQHEARVSQFLDQIRQRLQ